MERFDQDKLFVRGWLAGAGMHLALRAVNIGLEWHDGTRKDGVTPEFSHQLWQIQFVRTLANVRDLENTIVTIALHDLPEDRRYDPRWIRAEFGDVVADSVEAMSKKIFGKNADKSSESYYYQLALDELASVAKGCDRVHNHSTMPGVFTIAKMNEFMQESEKYVLPMLKEARKNFPHQEPAYSGLRGRLKEQIHLIRTCVDIQKNPGIVDVNSDQPWKWSREKNPGIADTDADIIPRLANSAELCRQMGVDNPIEDMDIGDAVYHPYGRIE